MTEEHPDFGQSKPFEKRYAGESKDDKVDTRLNAQERLMLNELKEMLRLDADSTALKTGMEIAHNVLQGTFGKPLLAYLCSPRRIRPGPK